MDFLEWTKFAMAATRLPSFHISYIIVDDCYRLSFREGHHAWARRTTCAVIGYQENDRYV
jgi:hypothetical protein